MRCADIIVASLVASHSLAQPPFSESPNWCDLCSGEVLIADQTIPLFEATCDALALNASQVSTEECLATLTPGFDVSSVCCENKEPPNVCMLCSEEEQLIPARTVTSQQYGQVACKTFEEAASLVLSMEVCQSLQEEAADICCVDLANSGSSPCEILCPNGSTPADLFKKDPVTGYTCADLVFEYSKFPNDDQCLDSAASSLGFDGVAFCCSDVDPPKECSTCPSEQELLYPERVLFLYHDHSCKTLDESLAYVVGETGCQQILDQSRAENNCLCRPTRTQTIPPSSPPIEANRGGSGCPASSNGVSGGLTVLVLGALMF